MIIIFACDDAHITHVYFLLQKYSLYDSNKKSIKLLWKFNKKYFDKADVIVPVGIDSQKKLHSYPQYKHKFLINEKYIYDLMDDKITFYNIINEQHLLHNSSIKLITTYDEKYNGPDKNGKFIIKHRNGYGSTKNEIITGKLYDLIKQYSSTHQIQDIIDIKQIHGVNCLCTNGVVITGLDFICPGFIDSQNNNSTVKQYLKYIDSIFMTTIKQIVKFFNYNGFVEFEFLEDVSGNIYLMEANPRISGNIKSTFQTDAPYVTNLIIPYCDLVKKLDIKLYKYKNNSEIIYHGDIKPSKYRLCDCSLIHFDDDIDDDINMQN